MTIRPDEEAYQAVLRRRYLRAKGHLPHLEIRPFYQYGDMLLSLQAGEMQHSTPRVNGLQLEDYATIEVGIIHAPSQRWLRPSQVGLPDEFDDYWDDDVPDENGVTYGHFVPWEIVDQVGDHLLMTDPEEWEERFG